MLRLKVQLISLKTMTKKWPVTEPLEFEPLNGLVYPIKHLEYS